MLSQDDNKNLIDLDETKYSKARLVTRIVTGVFSGLILLYLLIFVIIQVFFPSSAVKVLGFKPYLISYTGSMEPKLNYNDMIFVVKYDFDKLEVGDIITFMSPLDGVEGLHPITHRIEKIVIDKDTNQKFMQTKGVNLPYPDVIPVSENGINNTNKYIGKYVFVSPLLGHLFAFLKSGLGITVIIVNTLSIVGIYFVLFKAGKGTAKTA